jgi:hypothetical protein
MTTGWRRQHRSLRSSISTRIRRRSECARLKQVDAIYQGAIATFRQSRNCRVQVNSVDTGYAAVARRSRSPFDDAYAGSAL